MFKIITKFLSYFTKPNTEDTISKEECTCSIRFDLTAKNTINVMCYWPDLDELNEKEIDHLAKFYGTVIYLVDKGRLKEDIIEALSSISSKNNASDTYFVFETLNKWFKLVEQEENSKSAGPIIRPSSVFKNYIQQPS